MRIWVEIIGGRYVGARGWHSGRPVYHGEFTVHIPGRSFPRDAVVKKPGDLRALTEIEAMAEQLKRAA